MAKRSHRSHRSKSTRRRSKSKSHQSKSKRSQSRNRSYNKNRFGTRVETIYTFNTTNFDLEEGYTIQLLVDSKYVNKYYDEKLKKYVKKFIPIKKEKNNNTEHINCVVRDGAKPGKLVKCFTDVDFDPLGVIRITRIANLNHRTGLVNDIYDETINEDMPLSSDDFDK